MVELEPSSALGFIDLQDKKMFNPTPVEGAGITYIAVGMNYPFFDRIDQRLNTRGADISEYINKNLNCFKEKKSRWESASLTKLSHYEYLKKNIYE
jgi:hypothetical protein